MFTLLSVIGVIYCSNPDFRLDSDIPLLQHVPWESKTWKLFCVDLGSECYLHSDKRTGFFRKKAALTPLFHKLTVN